MLNRSARALASAVSVATVSSARKSSMSSCTSAAGMIGARWSFSVSSCGRLLGSPGHRPPLFARRRRPAREPPERRRARGVRDEMDAVGGRLVLHVVRTPVVEDPGFARGHVHRLPVTVECHLRLGEDRDVQPNPRVPVVVDIGVLGDTRSRRETHQPRAAPDHAKAREGLAQVRHAREPTRRQHLSVDGLRLAAAHADQPRRAVAGHAVGMRRPGLRRKGRDLGLQAADVEEYGQLEEGARQPHLFSPDSQSRRRPTPRAAAQAEAHVMPPLRPDPLPADRLTHLLGTGRPYAAPCLVESQAGRLKDQSAMRQHAPHAAFEILDHVLVLQPSAPHPEVAGPGSTSSQCRIRSTDRPR